MGVHSRTGSKQTCELTVRSMASSTCTTSPKLPGREKVRMTKYEYHPDIGAVKKTPVNENQSGKGYNCPTKNLWENKLEVQRLHFGHLQSLNTRAWQHPIDNISKSISPKQSSIWNWNVSELHEENAKSKHEKSQSQTSILIHYIDIPWAKENKFSKFKISMKSRITRLKG